MTYRAGVTLVILAGILWSLQGLVFRQIEVAGAWQVLFWRSLGMLPGLVLFLAWRAKGSPWPALRAVGLAGAVGGLGLVAAFGGAIVAIQSTTIANAVFLFAASPLLAALLGWVILREEVRLATWGAILVAAVGMLVMVREGLAAGALLGNLAALASALGFAAFSVALRFGKSGDMIPAVILGGIFAAVTGFIVLVAQGTPLGLAPRDLMLTLAMGAVILGGGMTLYTLGSRKVPAAEMTLLSMLEVLLAPVWVWLLFNETASTGTFIGGGIVLVAILFNAFSGARRKPSLPGVGPVVALPDGN
ncbi:MAG: DMT family transporter [Rhodobacteraceae bacterium]|nr:DMT family transporter [Paracoccaceae bacterium]